MKPLLREIWRSDRQGFLTILGWNILVSLLGGIGIVMLIPLLNQLEIGSGGYLPGFLLALPYGWRVAALLAAYVALVTVKESLVRPMVVVPTSVRLAMASTLGLRLIVISFGLPVKL